MAKVAHSGERELWWVPIHVVHLASPLAWSVCVPVRFGGVGGQIRWGRTERTANAVGIGASRTENDLPVVGFQ